MLRISQQSSADAAKSYYASAGADYYLEGQELLGRWGGEGARLLGLEGRVSGRAFNRLCENRNPDTGQPLTIRTKDERTVGYDFTFSVSKSVSLLYALGDDPEILAAFRESVHETMCEIEKEMKVRVRTKGQNSERVTGNAVWAEFIHTTSRPVDGLPDPQLHAHCFVFNSTFDKTEDRWKAGQFRDLKRDAPYFQAAFRARLANNLQDLGYAIERKSDDFEISGIPASAIKKFSRRTAKIEELARERGIEDPKEKDRLGGMTREKKDKSLTWAELTSEWRDRLTSQEQHALDAVKTNRVMSWAREDRTAAAMDFAIAHVFERDAVVPEKRLLAEALKHGLGDVTVEDIRKDYDRRKLPVEEKKGVRLVTTPAILAEEDRMVAFARKGRGTFRPLGVPERSVKRDWLNAGQLGAVEHILGSRDRVMLIQGLAGTGKTTLMQEAVEGIVEGGRGVVVLAPSAGASRDVLRKEGFAEADTVATFLRSPQMQQKAAGNVIWVDEAGLMGNKDMSALFEVAKRLESRVVLMGDTSQHSSPAYGTPLKLLEKYAGVPSVAVTEITRQPKAEYKKIVRLLAEGKTDEGLDHLDRLGWLREAPDQERYLHLAAAYVDASSQRKADGSFKTALVVCPTHAERERVTEAIREELTAKKKLGEEKEYQVWVPRHLTEAERGQAENYATGDMLQFHQNAKGYKSGQRVMVSGDPLPLDQAARFQVYRPITIRIAVNDRLRITTSGKSLDGHRLDNGATYTVKEFRDGNVVLDNGWVVAKDFGHLDHGYAVTSHASQGKTVDRVIIGQSQLSYPASDRSQLYVSVSRGREQAILFTGSKRDLRDAVARDRERLTATEVFRPRRPWGRERLKCHLSFMRRMASFDRPRENFGHDRDQIKEKIHER